MSCALQTAFLALSDYVARADIATMPTVTITFANQAAKSKFERLTRHDGLGYRHQLVAVSPRESLPPGVELQIAGIDIKYEVLEEFRYHPTRHRGRD